MFIKKDVCGRSTAVALALLAVAGSLCLALPGVVKAASSTGDDLSAIRLRVKALVTDLGSRSSLNRRQLTSLRKELSSLSIDLDSLQQQVDRWSDDRGNGDWHGNGGGRDAGDWRNNDDNRGDNNRNNTDRGNNSHDANGGDNRDDNAAAGWDRYTGADVYVSPEGARFDGWRTGYTFKADTTGTRDSVIFTVNNGPYTARWTIDSRDFNKPKVTVSSQPEGDVTVTLQDGAYTRELLFKNGGIGPAYIRSDSSPVGGGGSDLPPVNSNLAWYQPYSDMVRAGSLGKSTGMEWLKGQVSSDTYAFAGLAPLGRYLRYNLPDQPRTEIATLSYKSAGVTKVLSIPDPRSNVSGFTYAIDKLYNLYQAGSGFALTLK